ncbi:hypothetical protein [Luteibacter sp. RCC_6_2]|uniref:hypothetical protein n=1 Tax=Luteibacter sp. RCC_6_2 TaxID=3239223 RepID=UPI003524EDB0
MKGEVLVFKVMVAASAISAAVTLAAYFMATYIGGPWITDYLAFKINISLALFLAILPICASWSKRARARGHLTCMERRILDCVALCLPPSEREVWGKQIDAISNVRRILGGLEVNFDMRAVGRNPYFPLPRFSNENKFSVAVVTMSVPAVELSLNAYVWCASGKLFSIEYRGSVEYFAGMVGSNAEKDVVMSTEIIASSF